MQYDFDKPRKVDGVEVYWFDDQPIGGECRIPESWRVLYKDDAGEWKPVKAQGAAGANKDAFNALKFEAIETKALRIEAKLRPNVSGGILEWRVSGQ